MTFPGPGAQQPPLSRSYQDPGGQQLSGRRRRSYKGWFIASASLNAILLLIAIPAAAQHSGTPSSTPQAASTPAGSPSTASTPTTPAPIPAAAVAQTKTIARFAGSGIENTPQFTIGGDGTWKLDWTYNCSSEGGDGNFIVSEDQDDFNGVNVNELGPGGRGSTWAYNDAGSHYLAINSECAWTVKVIGQP